ncbi:AAA family ATPase [Variovorax sp. VNK109]|uniref:nSTAND1 domain-containing NTPase n=1 Tax=Variovorax sp. VNK109 TaxID=3400919 RepID=UPI003C00C6C3
MTIEDWAAVRADVTAAFSPGSPVQEKDLFAGRGKQISALEDAVNQRGRHAIVYGERGVGKTSLVNILGLVSRRPNRDVIYVRVNADPTDTFTTLWRKVFKRLNYTAEVAGGSKRISDDFSGDITPDDVQLVLEQFSENQMPIIVLDEFDRIKQHQANILVADTIKALADYSVNATLVVVGVAEDVSTLIEGHESITRSLIQIKMPRMSTDELKQLVVTRYSRCGLSTDADAVWKIVFLSRGLPYYAHLLAMNAARFAISERRLTVRHTDIDKALDGSITELDQSIREDYMRAIRSQRGDDTLYASVLLACAFAQTDELGRFQQSAVAVPLNKLHPGKNYQASTYAMHMNSFCEEDRGNVLQRVGTPRAYRYRFADPMMQPFIILKGLNEGRLTDEIAQIFSTKPQMDLGLGPGI